MLYRISVAERGLTGIANIFRIRLSGLDDLLRAGTVPFKSDSHDVEYLPPPSPLPIVTSSLLVYFAVPSNKTVKESGSQNTPGRWRHHSSDALSEGRQRRRCFLLLFKMCSMERLRQEQLCYTYILKTDINRLCQTVMSYQTDASAFVTYRGITTFTKKIFTNICSEILFVIHRKWIRKGV